MTSLALITVSLEAGKSLFYPSFSSCLIFPSSVITNTEEWTYFKELTKTPTPVEENMFHLAEGSPGPRIYLRPQESINIPMKYQSFLCDHTMAPQVAWRTQVDASSGRGHFHHDRSMSLVLRLNSMSTD